MKHKPLLLLLSILVMLPTLASASDVYPIKDHDGELIETCSATFTHDGGDEQDHYDPNKDYQITFISNSEDEPHLSIHFEFFQLGPDDVLYVYDGESEEAPLIVEATGQALLDQTIYSSGDSLHFHFQSSDFDPHDLDDVEDRLGWLASISCVSLCELFVVIIDPLDGLKQCPDATEEVEFTADAFYMAENIDFDADALTYTWTIKEETLTGQTVSYLFDEPEPGAYSIRVVATDPENDCEAETYEVYMVATIPHFDGTNISVDIACAEEDFTLYGIGNVVPWTGFPISVTEEVPVLIGLDDAYLYESSLVFDVFADGAEILSEEDFDRVCVIIEHVDHIQVNIELESPQGEIVRLKDGSGQTANLGEPVVWVDTIPGTGYEYCFSPFPQYGAFGETSANNHDYTDNAGNYYAWASYMPPGNYTPAESLNNFEESTFNGEWTIRVEDHTTGEGQTGHVFGWSLLFKEELYPDSLIFTPEIVEGQWYHEDSPIETTVDDQGNFLAVTNMESEGFYDFLFEITDNFGCIYDTTLTIEILPLPVAEILSDIDPINADNGFDRGTLNFCEGDSITLEVHPIGDDGFHWLYQWQYEGVDLPERTYDTLTVKETGQYTVAVTDTITGCVAFIDQMVQFQDCDLTIPNVFLPNSTNTRHQQFKIDNLEHYPGARMVIYNRWGKKVYEHNDYYGNWWDGDGAPDGTYLYVLRYTRMGVTRHTEGTVTIIR